MSIRTPKTWNHFYSPLHGGPFGAATLSDFAISPPCSPKDRSARCSLGYGGRLFPSGGSMVSIRFDSSNLTTIPNPNTKSQGWLASTIAGFPTTTLIHDDVACKSLGSPLTFDYVINLWVPASVELNFCVNGPNIEHQEAVAATVAASANFRRDSNSNAAPASLFGQSVTSSGTASTSQVPYCTSREVSASVVALAQQGNGRTTFAVSTTFRQSTSTRCGLPPLSTCGFYGDFAIHGPSGHVLWTWKPMTFEVRCISRVSLLPLTITVPTWSVPTKLLTRGTYWVRMVSFNGGSVSSSDKTSTSFSVH